MFKPNKEGLPTFFILCIDWKLLQGAPEFSVKPNFFWEPHASVYPKNRIHKVNAGGSLAATAAPLRPPPLKYINLSDAPCTVLYWEWTARVGVKVPPPL